MNTKHNDKLMDIYSISQAEATFYWKDKLYVDVLKDKVSKAKKLQEKLMKAPVMKRDDARIKRIGDAIAKNYQEIREVEIK